MTPPALSLEATPAFDAPIAAPDAVPTRATRRRLRSVATGVSVLGTGLWSLAATVAVIVIVTIVAVVPLGWRPLTVLSGSMTPTLRTGDVIISAPLRPDQARIGDVVTFSDPSRDNALVTHRIIKLRLSAGKAYVVTRGDANTGVEKWAVASDGKIGRVVMHFPKLGYLSKVSHSPWARLLLALPLLFGGIKLIVKVWTPEEDEAGVEG